jgi:hypothetical protein
LDAIIHGVFYEVFRLNAEAMEDVDYNFDRLVVWSLDV